MYDTMVKEMFANGLLMIGLGSGVSEAATFGEARTNGPCPPQICLLTSRTNVCALNHDSIAYHTDLY